MTSIDCEINRISWEGVNVAFHVTLTGQPHLHDVRFTIVDKDREFPVPCTRISSHIHQIRIDITNFQDRARIPDGTWRFIPHVGTTPHEAATVDLERLVDLDEDSRTFMSADNRVCHLVIFGISEDDERPELLMRTYQMFRNPKPTLTYRLRQLVSARRERCG